MRPPRLGLLLAALLAAAGAGAEPRRFAVYPTGPAPKQVTFSPDGRFLHVSLLNGKGFDVIDLRGSAVERVEVPVFGKELGFVEGVFLPEHSSFLISQMTSDMLHEYLLDGGERRWIRSFRSGGTWTKVLAFCPSRELLAVANWVSNDVTLIDYPSGLVVHRLRGISIPRGLAWSPDGKTLTVASFGAGKLLRYDAGTWERSGTIERPGGSMRHLVLSPDGGTLYASDMSRNETLEVDMGDFSLRHVYPTKDNPNTIELTPDGRILAVSCRGPNNPESYILRSPGPGCVLLFDTAGRRLLAELPGGTQPTGLDISPDGRLLAFSNFQDAEVELWELDPPAP